MDLVILFYRKVFIGINLYQSYLLVVLPVELVTQLI